MSEAVIVGAVRTPIGAFMGGIAPVLAAVRGYASVGAVERAPEA